MGASIDPSKSFRKNDRLAVALLSTSEVTKLDVVQ